MNKIGHWVASLVFFGIPFITATHSPVLDVTVGAILNGFYLLVSHYVNPTKPV